MFNKRDQHESESSSAERPKSESPEPAPRSSAPRSSGGTAMIGPSINVDGKLRGDEDLVIEGKVKGTVELKKNSVTIGSQGDVQADVYAHTIYVDGKMDGNLFASEQVVVRKSAQIKGSITSPRVSLEDGARFNGSIDMDAKSESMDKAFGERKADKPATTGSSSDKSGGAQGKSQVANGAQSAPGAGGKSSAQELNS